MLEDVLNPHSPCSHVTACPRGLQALGTSHIFPVISTHVCLPHGTGFLLPQTPPFLADKLPANITELNSHNFPPPQSTCHLHLPSLPSLLSQERHLPPPGRTCVPLLSAPTSQELSPMSSASWSGLSCVLPGAFTHASASQPNMTFPPPHSSSPHVLSSPHSVTFQSRLQTHLYLLITDSTHLTIRLLLLPFHKHG